MKAIPVNKLLAIIYIVIVLSGCADSETTEQLKPNTNRAVLTSEMSNDLMIWFSERTTQLLGDYVDLMEIISDTSVASEFRSAARQQIETLFIHEDVKIHEAGPGSSINRNHTLSSYLDKAAVTGIAMDFELLNISQESAFLKVDSGRLCFFRYVQTTVNGIGGPSTTLKKKVAVHAVQRPIKLAGEEKVVWKVLLGEISPDTD